MSVAILKPTKIVNTALGLLARELTIPQLVWRDPVGDFAGAFNDTISIRLPAYLTANSRVLRSGSSRTTSSLAERKVDLTLDTDLYIDVPISDEELTLDIADFGMQVLNPVVEAIGRGIEDKLVTTISGASYENTISFDHSTDSAYSDVAVASRIFLNQARVPAAGRSLVCGSAMEAAFLNDDEFIRADHIGASAEQTVRESLIGRVAGFDVYSSPGIASDEAYAFHQTAYALSNRAPVVPAGAPWGAMSSYQGLALRVVQFLDPTTVADKLATDSWLGAAVVTDVGHYDGDPDAGGRFLPVTDPANPITGHTDVYLNDSAKLVRAVKITVS